MIIHQIFPTPIYHSKLERALTAEELKGINEYKKKTYQNEGNITSTDNYVLENKTFKNLKEDLYKMVIDYFDKIICSDNDVIPYITQSWLNYTRPNEYHHKHLHPNSLVSGVFYVDAKKEVDGILFHKTLAHQGTVRSLSLELRTTRVNVFNSKSSGLSVQTGDVFLFPSTLIHGVDRKKGTNTRISLSFNVFFKGKLGIAEQLTELTIQ